jgi:hypothetical protein
VNYFYSFLLRLNLLYVDKHNAPLSEKILSKVDLNFYAYYFKKNGTRALLSVIALLFIGVQNSYTKASRYDKSCS